MIQTQIDGYRTNQPPSWVTRSLHIEAKVTRGSATATAASPSRRCPGRRTSKQKQSALDSLDTKRQLCSVWKTGRLERYLVQLFQPVIRRFLGDDHVVDVAFAQPRGGDAQEAWLLLQFANVAAAAIAHARSQAADQLIDQIRQAGLYKARGPRCLPAPASRWGPARSDRNCPAPWRPSNPCRDSF